MKIEKFLNPKYIAVIGASSDKRKVGRQIFDNALLSKKKIFPINNKEKRIAGVVAYNSVSDLPIKDWANLLIVIAIPAPFVLAEVEKAAHLGVKNFVIITAGFKEVGGIGKKLEEDLVKLVQVYDLNILGPNCLGFINNKVSLNLSFSKYSPNKKIARKNNIAFLSQSGAIGSAVLDWIAEKSIGLSGFISLGNKASLNESDFLEFFYRDSNTDLIVLYLEEISQGSRFLELVSQISPSKPVAVLKAGRSDLGLKMASSHTGSLAGSYDSAVVALKRAGAIILDNINQLYHLIAVIKGPVSNLGGDLAIVSNAGGPLVLASDQAIDEKLSLAKFSSSTFKELKKILPVMAEIKNPLDILGDASPERYQEAVQIVLNDKNVSSVLVLLTPQTMTQVEITAQALVNLKSKLPSSKNLIISFLGGAEVSKAEKILNQAGLFNFSSLDEAVKTISQLDKYQRNRRKIKKYQAVKLATKTLSSQAGLFDYLKSFQLLKEFKIKTVKTEKISKKSSLDKIKYPIALKMVGPDFIHKSDQAAVFLNVKNKSEALQIFNDFQKRISSKKISNDNYLVYQPMLSTKMELILGFKRDATFGPIILLGLGGIYAEVYKDTVLGLAGMSRAEIREMIKGLKVYPILYGVRGQKGVNLESLVETIFNFSNLILTYKDISEIDINPLLVDEKSSLALDVRIITM